MFQSDKAKGKNKNKNRKISLDLYEALSSITFVWQLLALVHFSLQSQASGRRRYVSKNVNVLGILKMSVVIGVMAFGIYSFYIYYEIPFDLHSINYLFAIALVIFSIFSNFYHREKFVQLFNELSAIDSQLFSYGVELDKQFQRMKRTSILQVASLVCAVSVDKFVDLYLVEEKIFFTVTQVMCVEFPMGVVLPLILWQFVDYALVLKQRFVVLNQLLVSKTTNNSLHFIHPAQTNMSIRRVDMTLVNSIRILHGKLCALCEELNDLFSIKLLCYSAVLFLSIVDFLYLILINPNTVGRSLWFLLDVFNMTFLAYSCSSTRYQAEETSAIIHQLKYDIQEEEFQTLIQMFSLQLVHQKVNFTAYGLFPLDYTLMFSIVSASVTFLVYIIQFKDV